MESNTTINQIAQAFIIIGDGRFGYANGEFIPVFQDALIALSGCKQLTGITSRVLFNILGNVDEKNCICITPRQIASEICATKQSVYVALDMLERMQIICHKGDKCGGKYELSSKLINPRLAYRGNTRKIVKDKLPLLISPDGSPLIEDPIFELNENL